ncbi:MAG: inositol monophosphatase family protein [Sphingomonadaceae bacterium]
MTEHLDPSITLLAETAVSAAQTAGSILRDRWRLARQIQYKGEINLVTDADRQAEEAIVSLLRSRFPDHQILAEEGSTGGDSHSHRWIIDPLDGTTNYAHGYPHFAVSIALERDGSIVLGVVYDPILNELFLAKAGEGAWLNGEPLRVSTVDRLVRSLLCTGFPYDRSLFTENLRRWNYFVRRAQGVRRDGSAALDICYVAAGRFDAFWENHLFPWDAAAAILLVREAGGTVTDYSGGEPDIYRGEIVASNGLVHAAMLEGLVTRHREHRRRASTEEKARR